MELKKVSLPALLTTLALMVWAVSARALTIPISGNAGWAEAREYSVGGSGPSLALSISTCDATEAQPWTGPFTFNAGSLGYSCTEGSASYGPYTWTANDFPEVPAPDEIDAGVTGIPGACGPMMVNPDGDWSEICAATFSGSFDAFALPGSGPGPSLSGTFTGSGTVDFSGFEGTASANVFSFDASFIGTAAVTTPVPEPDFLPLMLLGAAALLPLAVRRAREQQESEGPGVSIEDPKGGWGEAPLWRSCAAGRP